MFTNNKMKKIRSLKFVPIANGIRNFFDYFEETHHLYFIIYTSFSLLFTTYCTSQTTLDSTKLVSEFSFSAKIIQADELGNLYLVSPTNQLYKYNNTGKLLATLNYNYNGNISSIDASNPMELYVFYKEINRVLFLDNNLAYRGELDLSKMNITQAAAVARSYDNAIWIFDLGDLQLKKIAKDGTINQSSGNIKQFIDSDFIPKNIADNSNQIMLCNDSICLLFDVFAAYMKTLKFKDAINFQLGNDQIFETKSNQINRIDLKMGIRNAIYYLPLILGLKWSFISRENVITYDNFKITWYSK